MKPSEKDRGAAREWLRANVSERIGGAGGVTGYLVEYSHEVEARLAEAIATARAEGRTAGHAEGRREALEALLGVVEPWCDKSKWRRPTEAEACRLASFIRTHVDGEG